MKIVITGAGGYIGTNLARSLAARGHQVTGLVRKKKDIGPDVRVVEAIDYHDFAWKGDVFAGQDIVIHTAARVHYRGSNKDGAASYRRDNVDFSLRMATRAAEAGVKRFIFISSIGAQLLENSFHEGRIIAAQAWQQHPYRMSKLEAERGLSLMGREKDLSVTAVRLPMVYGKGAPGSFSVLTRLLKKGLPLPFGLMTEPRAFISIETVKDFFAYCVEHLGTEGHIWAIRDRDEISASEFALKMTEAAQFIPARLVKCPTWALKLGAGLVGYQQTANSLTEPLHVDLQKVEKKLGWRPPVTIEEGLKKAFT